MKIPKYILPVIVIAQFCCTSLWFAGNAVLNDLILSFNLSENALENLTSAVQFGFISGTLLFAIFTIADRFSPSKVFFVCAVLGGLCNSLLILENNNLTMLLYFRFLTGFFLAGIYPIGMKIATDYYEKGLGKSLSFLVGALVLGTALPHLLKNSLSNFSWQNVIVAISLLAFLGGLLLVFTIKNGPYRKKSLGLDLSAFFKVFKNKPFKKAAFGYFGHMWELYAFWTFVPVILKIYSNLYENTSFNISLFSFLIIGIGSIGCILGGFLAEKFGVKKIAFNSLLLSCICCLLLPFVFMIDNATLFIAFLLFWGMVVIADSPLFSTLVAKNVLKEEKGTALTIVNCIGFTITIISIQLISKLFYNTNSTFVFLLLSIGPFVGLLSLKYKQTKEFKVFKK